MIKGFLYQTIGIDLRGNYNGNTHYASAPMDYSNPLYGSGTGLFKDDLPQAVQEQKNATSRLQLAYVSSRFQDNARHHNQKSA